MGEGGARLYRDCIAQLDSAEGVQAGRHERCVRRDVCAQHIACQTCTRTHGNDPWRSSHTSFRNMLEASKHRVLTKGRWITL